MLDKTKSQVGTSGDRPDARLSHIAALLGCDVETFTHRLPGPTDVEGVNELLNLWVSIDAPTRTRLLEFARECAKAS